MSSVRYSLCSLFLLTLLLAASMAEISEDSNDVASEPTVEPAVSSLKKCDKEYPRMDPEVPLYFEQVFFCIFLKV